MSEDNAPDTAAHAFGIAAIFALEQMSVRDAVETIASWAGRVGFADIIQRHTDVDDAWASLQNGLITGLTMALDGMEPHWREIANQEAFARDVQGDIDSVDKGGYL